MVVWVAVMRDQKEKIVWGQICWKFGGWIVNAELAGGVADGVGGARCWGSQGEACTVAKGQPHASQWVHLLRGWDDPGAVVAGCWGKQKLNLIFSSLKKFRWFFFNPFLIWYILLFVYLFLFSFRGICCCLVLIPLPASLHWKKNPKHFQRLRCAKKSWLLYFERRTQIF